MDIQLTRGEIDKINRLYDELETLGEVMSENYKTIRSRDDEKEVITGWNNPEETIKMKYIFDEFRLLGDSREDGTPHRAYLFLREAYPDIFAMRDEEQKRIREITEYEVRTFGFDHKNVSMRAYINMTVAILDMMLKEKGL